jgi:hypothetical protein
MLAITEEVVDNLLIKNINLIGAPEEIRTPDPQIRSLALSP